MLIKNNTVGRIEDYTENNGVFALYGNKYAFATLLKNKKKLIDTFGKRIATAKTISVAPKESDFIYIRNRAVSAGNVICHSNGTYELVPLDTYNEKFEHYAYLCRNANLNGDFFPHEELLKSYKTFVGKSVFSDHKNDNVENAKGIILDAIYNENGYYVELLEAIDKVAFPQLANGITHGYLTDTSMGCWNQEGVCSICGHISTTGDDICEHIRDYKGATFNSLPVFEELFGIEFFEDSIVTEGADEEAKILERVASRNHKVSAYTHQVGHKPNIYKNELNQRFAKNRIQTLSQQLQDLPWS